MCFPAFDFINKEISCSAAPPAKSLTDTQPAWPPHRGKVPLQSAPMAAAPCHHSKDQPAPTHRGRDRLRRRRQRPSQVRSKTSGARPCEASGALLLSNGGTGGGHAACTLWPPKVGFRLAKAKSLCDLRIRLWRIRSLWRPLGTFPRGESTSSARRRTKPPTRNTFLVEGKGGGFLAFLCFAGFRLCGGDQRAFRSPFGNLRGPLLLKGTCKKFLVSGNEREPSLRFLFRGRQPRAPPQVVLSLS